MSPTSSRIEGIEGPDANMTPMVPLNNPIHLTKMLDFHFEKHDAPCSHSQFNNVYHMQGGTAQ